LIKHSIIIVSLLVFSNSKPVAAFWKACITAGAAQPNFVHICPCQAKDVFDNWRINSVANPEAGREKAVLK
jgi:hypothetical protein